MQPIQLITRKQFKDMVKTATALTTKLINDVQLINKIVTNDYHGSDDFYKIEAKSPSDVHIAILRMKLSMIMINNNNNLNVIGVGVERIESPVLVHVASTPPGKLIVFTLEEYLEEVMPSFNLLANHISMLAEEGNNDSTFALNVSILKPE